MPNNEYTVGKNKPPSDKKWTKGTSGNARGRPKGSKNRSTIVLNTLNKFITATSDGERKRIPLKVAVMTKLVQEALTGKIPAIKEILALWRESEEDHMAIRDDTYPFSDHDREVIATIHERMKACQPEDQS